MKKRVLLADDTQLMRELLRDALDRDKFEIVGEALTGEEAVIKYGELKPDLVIMDINMPKMNGIEALTVIMKKNVYRISAKKEVYVRAPGTPAKAYLDGARTSLLQAEIGGETALLIRIPAGQHRVSWE